MNRRQPLALLAALPWLAARGSAAAAQALHGTPAQPPLAFPRDHGAHPDWRTEWWYLTGRLLAPDARVYGFQVTFFRSRVDEARSLRSAFAARQLLFAHAAVTDLAGKRLWHDQRIARAGFGIAASGTGEADLRLRDWTLARQADGAWQATIPAAGFTLALHARPSQPVLLQGEQGLSRKGPEPRQASWYYSLPQLTVQARLELQGRVTAVTGRAWLDHEWSEELLHPEAVGWDWIGMNLADGGALTAFRLRRADGRTLWSGGSWRTGPAAGGTLRVAMPGEVVFTPGRIWRSPASGARYPVEWTVDTPAGRMTVRAALDDQELDSRTSTGAIYWEGLSELRDAAGHPVGEGYLEMTGYAGALRLGG